MLIFNAQFMTDLVVFPFNKTFKFKKCNYVQEKRLKELFDSIPTLDELLALGSDGFRADIILVDAEKDKKLSMLKQLIVALVKGLNSNPAAMIKKIAGLVILILVFSFSLLVSFKLLLLFYISCINCLYLSLLMVLLIVGSTSSKKIVGSQHFQCEVIQYCFCLLLLFFEC